METEKLLTDLIIWLKVKRHIWIKDFVHIHNISYSKLRSLAIKNENTKELLQIALEIQESKIIKIVLTSDLNSKILSNILECLNNSPVSFEDENLKPAPVINLILKEPKYNNPDDGKNINSNNIDKFSTEFQDSS